MALLFQSLAAVLGVALCLHSAGGAANIRVSLLLAAVATGYAYSQLDTRPHFFAAAGAVAGALLLSNQREDVSSTARSKFSRAVVAPRRACLGCRRLCAVSLSHFIWSLLLCATVVLHAEIPTTERDEWTRGGAFTGRTKIGVYFWSHRAELQSSVTRSVLQIKEFVRLRGWSGLKEDVLRELETRYTPNHKVLGIPRNSNTKTIKDAHRRLVKELHPDRQPAGSTEAQIAETSARFRRVQSAYEALMMEAGSGGGGKGAEEL